MDCIDVVTERYYFKFLTFWSLKLLPTFFLNAIFISRFLRLSHLKLSVLYKKSLFQMFHSVNFFSLFFETQKFSENNFFHEWLRAFERNFYVLYLLKYISIKYFACRNTCFVLFSQVGAQIGTCQGFWKFSAISSAYLIELTKPFLTGPKLNNLT